MRLTLKQQQLLTTISSGNPDGSLVDLDQILKRLPYATTKASLHFSIRAMTKRGLIDKAGSEKRRDRRHTLIMLTATGHAEAASLKAGVGVGAATSFVSSEEDDALETAIEEIFE